MNHDIDEALRQFAASPPHPAMARFDDAVFARITAERHRRQTMPLPLGISAAIGAILLGVASTAVPMATASASATSALAPFAPIDALAPSTLLAGE